MRVRRKNNGGNVIGVRQAYFKWLCNIVDRRRRGVDLEYRELATLLHSIEFYDTVPNDDNRKYDGMNLRDTFADEEECNPSALTGSCSVLEMLVALAMQMEDILFQPGVNKNASTWFWLLVKNMGLRLYLPDEPDAEQIRQTNRSLVRKMIERKYDDCGRGGGLFPLRNPSCDQRRQEIWYQMMEYICENDL